MITKDKTPSEVLDFNQALSVVFSRFDLPIAFQEKTIEEACNANGINPRFFIEVLKAYNSEGYKIDTGIFMPFPVSDILDYLRRTHDFYLNKKTLEIDQTIDLLNKEGAESSIVVFFSGFFKDCQKKLIGHIKYEETHFFPYIEWLQQGGNAEKRENFKDYSVERFENMHSDDIENELTEMREKIVSFHPQLLENSQFRVLLLQLHTFEKDLRIHGMIEDEVLLPKVKEMEKK